MPHTKQCDHSSYKESTMIYFQGRSEELRFLHPRLGWIGLTFRYWYLDLTVRVLSSTLRNVQGPKPFLICILPTFHGWFDVDIIFFGRPS